MEAAEGNSLPAQHPWRILVCDDSPIERLALSHFLRNNEFEVDEAADGESAIQLVQLRPLDLLVLDLQMPGKDGFDVLKYLQKNRPGLAVILLSGMPIEDIQPRIHLLPNRELPPLLFKPVDPQQMLELIAMELAGQIPTHAPPRESRGR
jgi:CheY-like chemotaxis protein